MIGLKALRQFGRHPAHGGSSFVTSLVFLFDWSVCGDDTIILDNAKANEVGRYLITPYDHVGSFLTLISELLDLFFTVPLRVSSFCFFQFYSCWCFFLFSLSANSLSFFFFK